MRTQKQFPILSEAKRSDRLTVALEPELKATFSAIARTISLSPLESNASNLGRILIAAFVEAQGMCGISRKRKLA